MDMKISYFIVFILTLLSSLTIATDIVTSHKAWWLKKINNDIYTTGRLSTRQIKYLSEAGVKSIISVFTFHTPSTLGDEVLPDTVTAAGTAIRLCGLRFITLLTSEQLAQPHQWLNVEMVKRLTMAMKTPKPIPLPVVIESSDGFAATLISLLYLALSSKPPMTSAQIYNIASGLGYDYTPDIYKTVITSLTKQHVVIHPPPPSVTMASWTQMWLIKPLYQNWFISGQIQRNHISKLRELGIVTIVNSRRQGKTLVSSAPSQEEVTLLNVKDGTGTYASGGRQSMSRLLTTRINPNKPNSYISPHSTLNFEAKNLQEYGDNVGYNETEERQHIGMNTINYLSIPIEDDGPFPYMVELFNQNRNILLKAAKKGNILVHCASGHRASVLALLAAGLQYKKNSTWAIQRGKELGYSYKEDTINLFLHLLDQPQEATKNKDLKGTFEAPPVKRVYNKPIVVLLFALVGVGLGVVLLISIICIHKIVRKSNKIAKYRTLHQERESPPLLSTSRM